MFSKLTNFFIKKPKINPNALPLDSISAYNKVRDISKKSTFCFAPSINMYFSWEGKVIACCFNQKYELGKYPEQSIKEISDQYTVEDNKIVLDKLELLIRSFEINPIHLDLYNSLVKKSNPVSIFNSILENEVDDLVAEVLRNFNKKIPLPKINTNA
jgi:hypothetical protein